MKTSIKKTSSSNPRVVRENKREKQKAGKTKQKVKWQPTLSPYISIIIL